MMIHLINKICIYQKGLGSYHAFGGFTLLEILIVVVIVGLLSSVALPRYYVMAERMKAKEGEQLLLNLYASQKHYELENGPDNFAANLDDLDIELRPSEYFENFAVSANPLAQIDRKGNKYSLAIDNGAKITCSNNLENWCAKLGY